MEPDLFFVEKLQKCLASSDQSIRLQAVLAAGTQPNQKFIPILISQCAIESDFFVRDMLTWALIMNDKPKVLEALIPELNSSFSQARSQALHTLSKIGDKSAYKYLQSSHIHDSNNHVARTAWRTAASLVPESEKVNLVKDLIQELGRGDFETQLSLSRALCTMGEVIIPLLKSVEQSSKENIQEHAVFTRRLFENPELERSFTTDYAQKIDALNGAPLLSDHIN